MRRVHPFTLAAIVALVLTGVLNVTTFIPPLQDFNEWIYQGWLVGRILQGAEIPFAIKPWPVPNAAAQLLLGMLNLPLGPRAAGIAFLILYLLGFGWLAWKIAERDDNFSPPTFLLAILLGVLNSPYWDGFANYQLGVGLFLLHVVLNRRAPTGIAADLAFGIAIFLCHAVMLAVFALHLFWRAVLAPTPWRSLIRAALVLVPPFAMLAAYVLLDDNYGEYIPPFGTSLAEFIAYKGYTLAKSGPYQNMIIGGIGDAARAPWLYWPGVALNLLFAVALLPVAFAVVMDLARGRRVPALFTALCCLAGFAVLPSALFGVVNVGERLLLPALLLALATATDPWRLRRIPAVLACAAPALIIWFFIVMPPAPPAQEIGHLAAHDPEQRRQVLFWHRPFQFHAQIAAAQRGEVVKLGFTTSLLRPVAR